ncbi:sulfotransferase family 2 domain-containing protein [Halothece sp. PCC 7418]|uniref:sulfotransferase family 2 domain-containing protein n=1 Tax=Halothece sp. (strain PCC 7418) TaxID=65093 RepID=UPI0021011A71|nr:sulfotransferase family 2 domain-containing protein [Halothece sp. PCC 7418]
MQKTAGITLQRMLRSRYGPHLLQRTKNLIQEKLNSSPDPVSLKKRLSSITMQDQYFMGHFCYGIHKFLPYPYTYITFLREPISRLLSLYRYSKLNSSAYYHGLARNASPKEFFFESNLMELDNGMLRFILGNPPDYGDLFINRTPVGKCNEDMLKQAKQNIENEFSFVGIVEKFDESVLLLKKQLNWKNPYYLRRNTYKNTNQNQPLTSSSWDFSDLMIEKLKEKINMIWLFINLLIIN